MNSIKIKASKISSRDVGVSRFFGDPVIPDSWFDIDFCGDNDILFAEIFLSDLASFDREKLLPPDGILYFFLDLTDYPYIPTVKYTREDPAAVIDDFNDEIGEELPYDVTTVYGMRFSAGEDDGEEGNKMLGKPYHLDAADFEEDDVVLFQYDPLNFDLNFLSDVEGMVYFVIKKSDLKRRDFGKVRLVVGNC